jgi:hypothetical protein
MTREAAISGKIICCDRGKAPDGSDRHLVMVVGVIAIPKNSKMSQEIKAKGNTISVGLLAGYNGGITLSHLENLGLSPDLDAEDWAWLRKEAADGLLTNYPCWQV